MKPIRMSIAFVSASHVLFLVCRLLYVEPQLTVNIKPKIGDNFSAASFTLYVPKKVKDPRYILILLPGFNKSGKGLLRHLQWLDFAEETSGAMVACTYKSLPNDTNFVHYAAAQHGSGSALESAIEQLDAKYSSHSLKGLPVLVYGHSAGGQFAYGFTCHNPKRMIGFAATKGGYYFPEPIHGTYKVPGFIVSGKKDLERRRKQIRALFESHRKHNAPWCWMEDSIGHEQDKCLTVIIPYFRELLKLRLQKDSNLLLDIPEHAGVTVDLEKKSILEHGSAVAKQDNSIRTAFLPSKRVFEAWALLDNGKVKYTVQADSSEKK